MARPETALTATIRFLDGLPLGDDAYANAKAAVVRSLADQVDNAKGSDKPNIIRSVPTIARQLSVEIEELQNHFVVPELTDRDRLLDWLNSTHEAEEIIERLGLDEVERRWLWTEANPYPGSLARGDLRRADQASGHFHSPAWWAEREAETVHGHDLFESEPV